MTRRSLRFFGGMLALGLAACAAGPGTGESGRGLSSVAKVGSPSDAAAAPSEAVRLDAELREILALLPGRYAGADAGDERLFHKIVPIVARQFGETVPYHQISRDGFDSTTPVQQKIYVFDRAPERSFNLMRSFVFLPKQCYANFERDAEALRTMQPGMLMSFPPACGIRWSRGESPGLFVARSRPEGCSFQGVVFKQRIRPDMTYILDRESFSVEDVLYGEDGQLLLPRTGLRRAAREP